MLIVGIQTMLLLKRLEEFEAPDNFTFVQQYRNWRVMY